jgi:hypothetical protein
MWFYGKVVIAMLDQPLKIKLQSISDVFNFYCFMKNMWIRCSISIFFNNAFVFDNLKH